jgi:hypothetical protein
MAASVLPWLTIAATAEPEIIALVKSLLALRIKYPALTPDQIVSMVQQLTQQADAEFDAVLQKIAADQVKPTP